MVTDQRFVTEFAGQPSGPPASRWMRLCAVFYDLLVMAVIVLPIMASTTYWDKAKANELSLTDRMVLSAVGFSVFVALNGYLLHKRGQSIGKLVAGIRIVSNESGQIPPLGRVLFLRYFVFNFAASLPIVTLLSLVDPLMVFRADRRCLHDFAAGTRVVSIRLPTTTPKDPNATAGGTAR